MGSTKNVDMTQTTTEVKVVDTPEAAAEVAQTTAAPKQAPRSKKYQAVRSKVDKTRNYDLFSAIELIKKLSYSDFTGTIEAHAQVREAGAKVDITYPNNTGKKLNVAIFDDAVLEKIENNNIDFDVLIAKPADMGKITKHARVLGPRGLMPNPKTGTLTDDPEAKKKSLESGKMTLQTEKKAPLIHTVVGKTDMETKELVENVTALVKALKGKLVKLHLAASMSPSVKVDFQSIVIEK